MSDLIKTLYLTIDSTYRDRNLYPYVSDFVINPVNNNITNKIYDPVSNESYVYIMSSRFQNSDTSDPVITNIDYTILPYEFLLSSGDLQKTYLLLAQDIDIFIRINDFYTGAIARLKKDISGDIVYEYRIITKYIFFFNYNTFINGILDSCKIELDSPFINDVEDGDIIEIINPSIRLLDGYSYIFIPLGENQKNFYANKYITDKTINETSKIIEYNNITKIAKVYPPFSNAWNNYDLYIIRDNLPKISGSYFSVPSFIYPNDTLFKLTSTDIIDINVIGKYLILLNDDFAIIDKKIIIDYLKIENEDYVVIGSRANILFNFGNFEILNISYDNYNPYYSSIIKKTRSMYMIKLVYLIVPNLITKSGGLLKNYPYIFVELYNTLSNTNNSNNIIFTNNYNCNKALFILPINDTDSTEKSGFLKIYASGMTQTIILDTNLPIRFTVKLPNGDLLNYIKDDNFSPNEPNNKLQISVCFSMRQI